MGKGVRVSELVGSPSLKLQACDFDYCCHALLRASVGKVALVEAQQVGPNRVRITANVAYWILASLS